MQPEELFLYKVIVLYILNRIEVPISNTELINLILEKNYASYVDIQQALAELIDDSYVSRTDKHNLSLYSLTAEGAEALSFFESEIAVQTRDDIDSYLEEKRYQLRDQVNITADYTSPVSNVPGSPYLVELVLKERGNDLLNIKLSVQGEKEAEDICSNWKAMNSDIYAVLLTSLLAGKLIVPTSGDDTNN